MKIDLDELARRGHAAALALRSAGDDGSQMLDAQTAGFLTNSPPVTLALVARIRELEIALCECGHVFAGMRAPPGPLQLIALLEKGAVLP